jgi:Flp pilus assembly protein TadG
MVRHDARVRDRGQIVVLFALGVVAIIAMVGLILDGGDTFRQRRTQQNASDLGAIAGANAYINDYHQHGSTAMAMAAAEAAARSRASANGYTNGAAGANVSVTVSLLSAGAQVQVGVSAPHTNSFARIVPGQQTWTVTTEATAITGGIDTAVGAAPWTMHITAFNNGVPLYGPSNPQNFGDSNGDYPVDDLDIAWTDYNGSNNVNTAEVRGIINGSNVVTATFDFDQYLGQHNQGNHTALYGDVQQYLAGKNVPVPIVGPPDAPNTTCAGSSYTNGCFKGWAMFHVISASGGSAKDIRGYFLPDGFQRAPLTVGECTPQQAAANQCGIIEPNAFDGYVVRLTD